MGITESMNFGAFAAKVSTSVLNAGLKLGTEEVEKMAIAIFNEANNRDDDRATLNSQEQKAANKELKNVIKTLLKENEKKKNAPKPDMGLTHNTDQTTDKVSTGSSTTLNDEYYQDNPAQLLEDAAQNALEYYRQHGSLKGLEESEKIINLRKAGYKIEYKIETVYDDSGNDTSTLLNDDGSAAEIVEVSDGIEIRIKCSKHVESCITEDIVQTAWARDYVSGDDQQKRIDAEPGTKY